MIKRTRALIMCKDRFTQNFSVEQPFHDGHSYVVFKGCKADCDNFMKANPDGFSLEECKKRETITLQI